MIRDCMDRRTALALTLSLPSLSSLLHAKEERDAAADETATKPSPGYEDLGEATKQYMKAKEAAQTTFRKGMARAIQHADRIEIYLLDFDLSVDPASDKSLFPILPYQKQSAILKQTSLSEEQRKELTKLFASVLEMPDVEGAFCHYPIHGVAFYLGEGLLFRTSLCWECQNYYVQFPDDGDAATWVGLSHKDFEAFMKKVMPIPESEVQRFEEKKRSK